VSHLLDPQLLFEKSHVQPGMHVADFGCGRTGHVVFPISLLVGEHGIVYAVDILKDVLESIRKRADAQSLINIHTVWSDVERVGKTAIPAKSLDIVFLVNTLSHGHQSLGALEEASRLLRDKGRIVVVDWSKPSPSLGPKEEDFIDFDIVKSWASSAGFVIQEEFEAGIFHSGLVLFRQQ
jgi:ubiquinone/menaquinone biosynthesis C-methylase UbiE